MRLRFGVLGVVAAVLVAGLLSGCQPARSYVALGDSYTAGPFITPQDLSVPGCLRSDANYPNLVAPHLDLPAFRDVSCSGAQTEDMTASQDVDPNPDNPPQFNALDGETRVVTLGIGGNDIGFSEIAQKCAQLGVENGLQGHPCQDFYTASGRDVIADRIAQVGYRIRDTILGIVARSPKAKIFVVGYPAILPENTDLFAACQPLLPIAAGDVPYLRDSVEKKLNARIREVTLNRGKVFVDTYTPSIGHDACQAPGVRWVEPVIPASDSAPVHPNRLGEEAAARTVLQSMAANGVAVS